MPTRPDASQLATGAPVNGATPTYQDGALVWVVNSGGVAEVANLTALALVAGSAPGLAWVQSLKCFWRRETASIATADGITVIAATGGGRWERLISTTALDWLYQSAWYVDQVAGSDEADGSSGAPVQSVNEVNRRLSIGEIHQDVTIHIQNGYFDEVWLDVDAGGRGHVVSIIGHDFTELVTDTTDTWTNYSHVTPAPNTLIGDTITDWSPYFGSMAPFQGVRIRNAAGPAGNVSWAYNESPTGTAWVGNFPLWVGDPPVSGGVGASFIVESVDAGFGRLKLSARDSSANFEVMDVFVGEVDAIDCQVTLVGCFLYESDYPNQVFLRAEVTGGILAKSCGMQGYIYPIGPVRFRECTSFSSEVRLSSENTVDFYRCTLNGDKPLVSLVINYAYHNREGYRSSAFIEDSQCWGGNACVLLDAPCDIKVYRGELSGHASSGPGLRVRSDGCSFTWIPGSGPSWTEPNLTGSSGDIIVALNSINLNASWSTVNIRNLEQRGIGTLSSGQATVSARGANYWGVLVSRATRSGGAGELCVVLRSHAGFSVDSLDSAGTLVTTDNGTFDWYIPGPAVEIVIGRELDGTRGLSVLS